MKLNITIPAPDVRPEVSKKTGWESPVGWWKVTTEGDCEGRTTDTLGTFYGHVAEIALATRCGGYSLRFEPVKNKEAPAERPAYTVVNRNGVHVSLDINSGTWESCKSQSGLADIVRWLDAPEIVVKPSNYYASFRIELVGVAVEHAPITAAEARRLEHLRKERTRAKALAKLTDEDRRALGL